MKHSIVLFAAAVVLAACATTGGVSNSEQVGTLAVHNETFDRLEVYAMSGPQRVRVGYVETHGASSLRLLARHVDPETGMVRVVVVKGADQWTSEPLALGRAPIRIRVAQHLPLSGHVP